MNHEPLLNAEENWQTEMGAWIPIDHVVVRGKDLFTELSHFSWMELLLFVVTGRNFSRNQIELFDRIWVLTMSYPDPRLWNNRQAALAGSARSTGVLGVAAATAVTEAQIYGQQATTRACDFIIRMKAQQEAGADIETCVLEELKQERSLGGYGHPLANRDPRIIPVLNLLEELGFSRGPHVQLALEIEKILQNSRYKMNINAAGIVAAIVVDQGFTGRDFYGYLQVSFSIGFLASYFDAVDHPEGSFFPLRCSRINYKGVKPRRWKTQ